MRAWPASSAASRVQRGVERDHVDGALRRRRLQPFVERDARLAAAALQRVARARALDQDLPHRVRRDRAEVRAVLPALRAVLQQLQVRLVDERRRLQRLARALALEIVRGEPPQLGVDQRHQRLERGLVPVRRAIDEYVERRQVALAAALVHATAITPFDRDLVDHDRRHRPILPCPSAPRRSS